MDVISDFTGESLGMVRRWRIRGRDWFRFARMLQCETERVWEGREEGKGAIKVDEL
ncbi:hypothetical protein FRX31_004866, partial [Thalictrum thalictroides]